MAINLHKIFAYIDEIGIEATVKKLNSYDVIGPSSEDFFGDSCVHSLNADIQANNTEETSESR